jgi:hypothetical protein
MPCKTLKEQHIALTPALEAMQFPCTETGNRAGFLFWDQNLMVEVQQFMLIYKGIHMNAKVVITHHKSI